MRRVTHPLEHTTRSGIAYILPCCPSTHPLGPPPPPIHSPLYSSTPRYSPPPPPPPPPSPHSLPNPNPRRHASSTYDPRTRLQGNRVSPASCRHLPLLPHTDQLWPKKEARKATPIVYSLASSCRNANGF